VRNALKVEAPDLLAEYFDCIYQVLWLNLRGARHLHRFQ
jgi:hypothetical protein